MSVFYIIHSRPLVLTCESAIYAFDRFLRWANLAGGLKPYEQKLNKLLSVYKDSDSWTLLDLRYAFNYLYYIAQTLKQNGESNDAIDFWIEDAFVRKFVVE